MTAIELKKMTELRVKLRNTGLFAFERYGTYLLYREVEGGRNVKVLTSTSVDDLVARAAKAVGVSK